MTRWSLRPSLEAVVIAVFFVLALKPPADSDTFLHLATGRYVLQHGIPTADPFSHTVPGRAWLAHEWLAATVMQVIYGVGGLGLVVWVAALVSVLVLAAVLRLLDVEEIGSPVARVTVLLAVGVCMRNVVLPRPHLITLLFLAVEWVLLARVRRGGSAWTLVALPCMFVAWGNAHGGFVLGGLPLGMAGLDALADARAGDPTARRRFAALLACGVSCVAALCVNPHGARLLAFPFAFDARAPHLSLVDEWAIPDYREKRPQALVLVALCAAPLLWPTKARAGEVAGVAAGVHLALQAIRNQFLIGLSAAAPLARCVQTGAREGALAPVDRKLVRLFGGTGTVLPVAALLSAALLFAVTREWIDPQRFPEAAADWIQSTHPPGRLFNEYDAGGYLLWRLRGIPVFIDGRIEIYHRHGVLPDYLAIADARPGFEDVLKKYDIGFALVHDDAPLARALAARPRWTRTFSGDGVSVYVFDQGRRVTVP